MDLHEQDCVLEIGRHAFSVTRITRETVRFRAGRPPVACGRTMGRLNFGGGVCFCVSGTLGVAGDGQGVLRNVRVLQADTRREEHFHVAQAVAPPRRRHPMARCA